MYLPSAFSSSVGGIHARAHESARLRVYTAGYYPPNYDFMAFAAMMIGRGADATRATEKVATLLPTDVSGAPGTDFLQHWSVHPLLVRVRFAKRGEILEVEAPPEGRPHSRAIWHCARGRALGAPRALASEAW
jgi:hypothetical protein